MANEITLFLLLQAICVFLIFMDYHDQPGIDKRSLIIMGIVPVISYLMAFFSLLRFMEKIIVSKGKCIEGHKYERVSRSNQIHNTPIPISAHNSKGQIKIYRCKECGFELIEEIF